MFAYRFDWDELPTILGVDLSKLMGAMHAAEIPFVFESFDDRLMNWVLFSDENIPSRTELSRKMSSYWAEFAYNGAPGSGAMVDKLNGNHGMRAPARGSLSCWIVSEVVEYA